MVFFREPWYLWRNKYLFSYEVPEFQILESEFWFSDSSDIGIQKKNPTGIFGIENRIGILLTMGVPEIGTKHQNSQPSIYIVMARHCNTWWGWMGQIKTRSQTPQWNTLSQTHSFCWISFNTLLVRGCFTPNSWGLSRPHWCHPHFWSWSCHQFIKQT